MTDVRKRIEKGFESFTRLVFRNRWKTVLIIALFVAAIVSNLSKITIDTSTEGFLHESDPALVVYNEFRDQFGRDEMVIVALNPENVFDIAFLKKLRDLHYELKEKVPHLDDITSMVNARNTLGKGNELIVEDLLENFPETGEDLAVLRERVLSNPIYENMLISEDGTFTTIAIKTNAYSSAGAVEDALSGFEDFEGGAEEEKAPAERKFLTDEENSEVVEAVREIVEKYEGPDFPAYIAGSPVVSNDLKRSMQKDMRRFMLMAVTTIAIFLYIMFRRISGVVLPLVVVLLTLFSAIGAMGFFGVPLKMPTQILPSFLMAVCVGATVHVMAIFYYRLHNGYSKEDSIVYAMGHSGLPIVMTSLTTAAGLASFSTAEVAPIADLGKFASLGVLLGLVYTIVLLPALIAFTPFVKKETPAHEAKREKMDGMLTRVADFSTGHPVSITAVSAVLIVALLAFASTVRFSHNPLKWFPEESQVRQTTTLIDHKMKGTVTLEVITDTGGENRLYEPEILKGLDGLATEIEKIKTDGLFVGKAFSVADILKEINRALNENRQEFYRIPDDRRLIAQEFLLFENSGSDDLEDVVDSQFSLSRFTVKAPWLDAIEYAEFIDDVKSRFDERLGQDVEKITITGMIPILSKTLFAAMKSAAVSYVIAGAVITFMMMILIGSVRVGLLSMIPNLLPIIMAIGVMGVFNMPMDMFTMLIGSIAIGLAVDDTVHFMHNFRRYYHETHDAREATRRTLTTTGRAMLATTVVLSTGFFIFMFATMNNLFNFGLLTGLAIVTALLADFLLAPALMTLMARSRGTVLAYIDKGED
ncbi:MAG: efflux RND transporter permease subunit [Candidatus Nitrospinota bacterium M3_3B_026]